MNTIEIYKDRNDNYYVQAGDYKVRIADGTRHDGTTIGHFDLVKKLTIPVVVHRRELLLAAICEYNKFNTQKDIKGVDDWLEKWDSK